MKKILVITLIAMLAIFGVACSNDPTPAPQPTEPENGYENGEEIVDATFAAGMVTDESGVNDQSFNQSSWDGLLRLSQSIGANVSYLESDNPGEIRTNMDRMLDQDKDIIWVIGFLGAAPVTQEATLHTGQMYGLVDYNFGDDILPNVVAVEFLDNEASFLAGYLAARQSNTGVIGFLGGMEIPVIERFEAGFRAGAAYANAAHGLDVEVLVQYIGDFTSSAIARGISTSMVASGADVLYAAAGAAGQGTIDVAIESNIYVIGEDLDQSHLAPDNMITSTLKHVGEAIYDVSLRLSRGENIGGQNLVYGIAQGAVGITDFTGSTAALVDAGVHADTVALGARIASGALAVPANLDEFAAFEAGL